MVVVVGWLRGGGVVHDLKTSFLIDFTTYNGRIGDISSLGCLELA